jgi:hypothetical protein
MSRENVMFLQFPVLTLLSLRQYSQPLFSFYFLIQLFQPFSSEEATLPLESVVIPSHIIDIPNISIQGASSYLTNAEQYRPNDSLVDRHNCISTYYVRIVIHLAIKYAVFLLSLTLNFRFLQTVASILLKLELIASDLWVAMDDIINVFANAYKSKRLVYRDIENTDADKEILHRFGPANHVSWGLLGGRLFRDVSKKDNFDALGKLLESDLLLKVLICLPTTLGEGAGELSKLGLGGRAAIERETATPIGSLTLSAPPKGFRQAPTTTVGLCIAEEFQNKVRQMKNT